MALSNETNITNLTPIQQFYANSKIFITGGTGFLGTILVEKLLRSCPTIHTIYLLIRSKNGIEPDDRLTHYFDDIVFDAMKKENPNYRNQVKCVHGDVSEDGLGLNKNDRITLIEKVNIVFHGAATVNFNENLQRAILINIKGTREVIALSRQMKNLKFITHISTAYVHTNERILEEKLYKSSYKANELLAIAENISRDNINKITSILIENFHNTYNLTKTISEELIEACNDLPIAVFRPAIVSSALKEPLPGWINNFYGATWGIVGVMTGLIRTVNVNSNVGANIVPVDMSTNILIAIPWQCRAKYEMTIKAQLTCNIPIYNYETITHRYLSWRNFLNFVQQYTEMYPPVTIIMEPFVIVTNNYILHTINAMFLHYFPAIIIDGIFKCLGKKSKLLKQYKMIDKIITAIRYITKREFYYKSNNLIELCSSMSQKDKEIFFCDLRELDWSEYFKTCTLGCRTYLLKDDISTIKYAKKRYFCIKVATRLILLVTFGCLISFLVV